MKIIKIACFQILIIGIFINLSSCHGQHRAKIQKVSMEIGTIVPSLDKTIWSIYQDKMSNFWFGSKENGLYFYNGKEIINITTADGLVSNEIRGFQEDANGNIFIETERGVSKFDGLTMTTLPVKDEEAPDGNWTLKSDDLWFRIGFITNGVYRYDGESLELLRLPKSPQEDTFYKYNTNSSLRPYGLYTIYKDRKGFMWFGTSELGVCRFDGKTLGWHYEEQLQTTPEGGDFGTRAIFEDRDGMIWINNTRFRYAKVTNNGNVIDFNKESGIGFFNENSETEFPFFLSITEDNDGNLWMVTYGNGVWKYDGEALIHYPIKDGEIDVLLFTIHKDSQGVLWLGTHNAGVYKFNGTSFEKFLIY